MFLNWENGLDSYFQQKGNFVNVVRKAQAAAWEEKFMAMKAKQKEANKVRFFKSHPTDVFVYCSSTFAWVL